MGLTEEQRREIRRLRTQGMTVIEVARTVGVSLKTASRVHREPNSKERRLSSWCREGPRLSLSDREEISRGLARRQSLSAIARRLGRSPSTISREVKANGGRKNYRAWSAHEGAYRKAKRPKAGKLAHGPLAEVVATWLEAWWSPEEIAKRLPIEFPHDPMMRVSHETIYQSIYVQGRGELLRELARCLRSGRAERKPRDSVENRGRMTDMVMISERPAEVEDRAVPGHWEGDLLIGAHSQSQVGTLVERNTGYLCLVHLPKSRDAETVARAMRRTVRRLPADFVKTITWDQGREMSRHARFTVDTGIQVYFCDPKSPWQRPSNENTNGLLRQYMPKGMDLSKLTRADLDAIARSLNDRPRKRFGFMKPSERFAELVASTD